MQIIKAHSRRVTDIAFSPNGNRIASCGIDGTVRVHETEAGASKIIIPKPKRGERLWERVAFTPDGEDVLCRVGCGLQRWGVATASMVREFISPDGFTHMGGLAVSHARHLMVVNHERPEPGRRHDCLRVWNLQTGEEKLLVDTEQSVYPGIAFDGTGTKLATSVGLFDVVTGKRLLDAAFKGFRLTWSPTAPLVAGNDYNNVLTVTNAETGQQVVQLSLPQKHVQDLAFSPDGRFLAVASNEAAVRVWDTATWAEQRQYAWDVGKLRCIAFSPDGLRAACGSETGRILVWDWDL